MGGLSKPPSLEPLAHPWLPEAPSPDRSLRSFSESYYLELLSAGQEVPPRVYPLFLLLFTPSIRACPRGTSEIISLTLPSLRR